MADAQGVTRRDVIEAAIREGFVGEALREHVLSYLDRLAEPPREDAPRKLPAHVLEEAMRTGKMIAYYGDYEPERAVVSATRPNGRPWNEASSATPRAPQRLYVDLRARLRPRRREHAPRTVRRQRTSSASRDGPASSSDDDPDGPDGLTPLQRAILSLREALEHGRYDRRTPTTFADVLTLATAVVHADLLDDEERLS